MNRAQLSLCDSADSLATLYPSPALRIFRLPEKQHRALIEIAQEARCCVTTATDERQLVAYAAFHPPSEIETWGADRTGKLIELGAIEVDPAYRGQRLAQRLLELSFSQRRFDDTIVFATMYVWHYDMARTGLSDFQYKRMLEKLYRTVGMEPFATSDPDIRANAANQLMARVGPTCPEEIKREFDRLRLQRPAHYGP